MVLNKRYKRDIKTNLSLYVSVTLLTVLSLLLFYLYYICGAGIGEFGTAFFKAQQLEDANFSTYKEIPDEEIKNYEEKYNLILEKQPYINIKTDGVTARVFMKSEKLDLYKLTVGENIKNRGEIIMSEGFALVNGIKTGDKIKIRDSEYTVAGFMERPDYLYMLENPTDAEKNTATFFICYMHDEDFDALGEKNIQYLIKYNEDNIKELRQDINDKYIMSSYLSKENNIRIKMVTDQPEIFIQMAYLILFILPLVAVMFISIILSRKIRNEQKMIGTLAAQGYKKSQIIRHYAGFSAIAGITGGILTTILVAIFAQPYGELGLMDYEPLKVEFSLDVPRMLLGIILPTFMYVLSTVLTVRKLLKNDITVLLAGEAKGRHRTKKFLADKDCSLRTKFTLRSLTSNPGRGLVLFIGVFLGSLIILFAYGAMDSADHLSEKSVENMGGYSYQYILNALKSGKPEKGETILAVSSEGEDGSVISVLGADGNSLLGLKDKEGNSLYANDGYIITSLYAKTGNIEKGDTVTLINPLSAEEFEIKVSDIADNDMLRGIYTSRKNIEKFSGIDSSLYNMILSETELSLPENEISSVVSRDNIEKQYAMAVAQMETLIDVCKVIGVLICIISVYIAVNMTVNENAGNISMLRVLGYDDKKINALLLRNNIFIVIPAIILSFPVTKAVVGALYLSFVDTLGYLIEVYINPLSYVFTFIFALLSYYISLIMVKRKISKVNMTNSLKDNRE